MTRFQLVFRRDGKPDDVEQRYNDEDGDPASTGSWSSTGRRTPFAGAEWLLRRDDLDGNSRFVCTLVVEPTET